jgi:hypothetical protein
MTNHHHDQSFLVGGGGGVRYQHGDQKQQCRLEWLYQYDSDGNFVEATTHFNNPIQALLQRYQEKKGGNLETAACCRRCEKSVASQRTSQTAFPKKILHWCKWKESSLIILIRTSYLHLLNTLRWTDCTAYFLL